MDEHLADTLQQGLGVQLPRWYTTFLSHAPNELRTTHNSAGKDAQVPADHRLLLRAEEIIHMNRDLWSDRDTPWMTDGSPWPTHYLVIGEDGGGNFAVIDLKNHDERIWWYDHDAGEGTLSEIAPNLPTYAQQLIAEFQRDLQVESHKKVMNQARQERRRLEHQSKTRRGGPVD